MFGNDVPAYEPAMSHRQVKKFLADTLKVQFCKDAPESRAGSPAKTINA
jgi:hypothetical protein